LAELADALATAAPGGPQLGFEDARGELPLPVVGRVTARFGDPDPLGRGGAGWSVEAAPFAQVSAPWDGTVRYAGPLGRYGKVVVLEPESGYLIVLAGLGRVDREVGEVVLAGEKLGDLGGPMPSADEFLFEATTDDDLIGRETLYLELRRRGEPLDPAAWFDEQARQG
ncbi:MAG TPA: peptidoglycan DD-metalloendopeptidase family protein, partial [Thermohalobaculum sp.]|nr:peptidoglycan DD-metalloendopeptidase family protein [Thermohalobaculum sp.]